MRHRLKRAVIAALGVALAGFADQAKASTFYGLSDTPDQELVAFDASPNSTGQYPITAAHFISGTAPNEQLLSIAYGPLGQLYALGSQEHLYELSSNGIATPVGQFATQLNGTSFGLAVDPLTSNVRVTSNLGQNLLLTLTGLPIAQGNSFSYVPGQTSEGNPLTGTPVIEDVAFGPGPNPTLYGIDANSRSLVTIGPAGDAGANDGQVTLVGEIGNITARSSLDIAPNGAGYISEETVGIPADTTLFPISITNGQSNGPSGEIGYLYSTAIPIRSIATPEPASLSLLALGGVFLLKRRPR